MRILHVIISLDPAGGGPQVVAPRLAAAQAARGCEVHLLTYRLRAREAVTDAALESIPYFEKVQKHHLEPPDRLERLTARRGRLPLADLASAVEVLHLHGIWAPIRPRPTRLVGPHGRMRLSRMACLILGACNKARPRNKSLFC